MKTIILLLMALNCFASSPKRTYVISDISSITIIEESKVYKKISILTGIQKKEMIIASINRICLNKEISCKLSDNNTIPLSRLILEVSGTENSIKNIEKLID